MFSVRAPFYPPLSFDVSDLLLLLEEQTSFPEERTLICKRYYAQSRGSSILSGTGALMRTVNFAVFCALVLRNAWRIFRGTWNRHQRPEMRTKLE